MIFTKSTRYLHLNGDPVGYPKPVALLLRPEFMAAALCVAAFACAKEPETAYKTIPAGALALGLTLGLRESQRALVELGFGDKVIDKDPAPEAVAASFKYRAKAHMMYKNSRQFALINGSVVTGAAILLPGDISFSTCLLGSIAAYHTTMAYNFKKLTTGEWAFVDEPPKDKVFEHLKKPDKATSTTLAPQVA